MTERVALVVRRLIRASADRIFDAWTRPEHLLVWWFTVRFEARGDSTEVVIVHEQIPNAAVRESHEAGWSGCLDGLRAFLDAS